MILFYDDWGKYPNAIIHHSTKNESFVHIASVYKKLGIRNHAFMLALTQPELEHIDPYDVDNLDTTAIAKIAYECTINPWYYFREIARVPASVGVNPIPFKANRGNIALYWSFFNHITSILIQPRQTGKSVSTDMLMIYLLNIGTSNTSINMLTRSDQLRATNLERLKRIQGELPPYLDMRTGKDIFNTEEIILRATGNNYKGSLTGGSEKSANNTGRGFTSPILHVDEACFIEHIKIAMTAALMAGNAAREQARLNNLPYGTIITTTTGRIDDRDASYIHKLWQEAAPWSDHFFDCTNEEELRETVYKNSYESKRLMVNITMSYLQLGKDDEWMRQQLEETFAEGGDADRDLFNRWTTGNYRSPLPKEYTEIIRNSVIDEPYTEIYDKHNFILRWYIDEQERERRILAGHSFIIGVDTSDAAGRDEIAMVIRDHTTGENICTSNFNEVNLISIASFFSDFLLKYENALLVMERRSSASAILDYIAEILIANGQNPFRRIYNTVVQFKHENPDLFEQLVRPRSLRMDSYEKHKKRLGFATSGSGLTARSELFGNTLMSMCKFTGDTVRDRLLADQLLSLVIRNNRIDHPEGGRDDIVVASLLSYWLLLHGKNLESYSVDSRTVLSKNGNYIEEKYGKDALDKEEVMAIEQEVQSLLDQYREARDIFIKKKIEHKLTMLVNQLNINHGFAISVSQLIEDLDQKKKIEAGR